MSTQHLDFIHVYKEFAMARFVQPHLATHHSGLFSGSMSAPKRDGSVENSRILAAMLMAAVMAALLVVADQLIDTWVDGHLMLAWVLMWSVAFAALALLAVPMRHITSYAAQAMNRWWVEYQRARDEEAMWEYAKRDPRVMAELQAARSRQSAD
jgi:hypothetical protein